MPYIIPAARPPYDALIADLTLNGCTYPIQKKLIGYLQSVPPAAQDGQFNYFITKILVLYDGFHKPIALGEFRRFLIAVMKEVYVPECYENYDRACGMLWCCMAEYQRRNPRSFFLVQQFMISTLEEFYTSTIGKYEDKKIAENGDVY